MSETKELVIEISQVKPHSSLLVNKQFDHTVVLLYVPTDSDERIAISCDTCLSFEQAIQFAFGLSSGIKLLNPTIPLTVEYIDCEDNVSFVPIT